MPRAIIIDRVLTTDPGSYPSTARFMPSIYSVPLGLFSRFDMALMLPVFTSISTATPQSASQSSSMLLSSFSTMSCIFMSIVVLML